MLAPRGRGAYPVVPLIRLLRTLRSGSRGRRPSGLGCLRLGWQADPRTLHRCPQRRLRAPAPRPAPGMRAGRLGLGSARGGAGGAARLKEGGTPLTEASGLPGSPLRWAGFPFHSGGGGEAAL